MFDPSSRYYELKNKTFTTSDGQEIAYKKRRFLPQGEDLPLLVEATVQQGERLDHVTNRTLGDPEQFWQICDANNAMHPLELVAEPGLKIRVPLPQPPAP